MDEATQRKIFSKNLNNLLSLHSLTQKEVADKIGISPQTFNTWCKGIALPRMGKVQLLSDFFEVNKSTLIEKENSKNSIDNTILNFSEKELLNKYDSLNTEGQKKLLEYLDDLISLHKYTKNNPVRTGKKVVSK